MNNWNKISKKTILSVLIILGIILSCTKNEPEPIPPSVSEISVHTPPTKVSYESGEKLELLGLTVSLAFDNGETEEIEFGEFTQKGITCTPINGTEITESTSVIITHTESGKNTTQNISLKLVLSISVASPPTKREYYAYEYLDLKGLTISLNWSEGNPEEVEFSNFSSYGLITSISNGDEISEEDSEIIITHEKSGQTTIQAISLLTLTDVDGNKYEHLRIGDQIWMKENLKTTSYQNGDLIGTTTPADLDISAEVGPKYQWAYDGVEENAEIYGRLYTKYVAADSRNVCPVSWHVPSSTEFFELVNYLAINGHNYDEEPTNFQNKLGKAIASKTNWNTQDWEPAAPGYNSETNNSSGFTGLPGGYRSIPVNGFGGMSNGSAWWSSTSNEEDMGYALNIQYFQIAASVGAFGDDNLGHAIRCIKD